MVVDGLPLHAGVQLAMDTTLVVALRGDGTARRGAADADGAAFVVARRRKERRYPELVEPGARSRLVVLGVEVGGRWSAETSGFLGSLVRAKYRCAVPEMRKRAEWSWRLLCYRFSLARPLVPLPLPCWSSNVRLVLMVRCLPCMRTRVTSTRLVAWSDQR